ncbi:efflux RND transporter periplasmic adaptor subunit [bacterium]|nr:efflux RND transporter periplasmic adaptor subunit [bacterium]
MTKKNLIILIISITVLTALYFLLKPLFIKMGIGKYQTEKAVNHTIEQVVEASGTINPVNTVSVGSTVSGLMMEVYVDFNSKVKEGQLIALMDTSLFDANCEKTKATLISAKADYAKQKAITEHSLKTYNRYKNLVSRNFMAKSELDAAEADYLSNKALLEAAQAKINQAQADSDYAERQRSFAFIYSPVDGVIVTRNVDPGQPVAASFQAPELFTVARDLKEMQIEVSVSEADIGKIQEGQEADYTLDGYPDEVFKGRVSQVRISPTTVSNVVTYTVIVAVDNDDLILKPGMTANVSIITQKKEDVLCVPSIALKYTPVTKGEIKRYENQGVWVLKSRKPERIDVETGASDDSYTEITSGDLEAGDEVIVGTNEGGKNKKGANNTKRPMRMF